MPRREGALQRFDISNGTEVESWPVPACGPHGGGLSVDLHSSGAMYGYCTDEWVATTPDAAPREVNVPRGTAIATPPGQAFMTLRDGTIALLLLDSRHGARAIDVRNGRHRTSAYVAMHAHEPLPKGVRKSEGSYAEYAEESGHEAPGLD